MVYYSESIIEVIELDYDHVGDVMDSGVSSDYINMDNTILHVNQLKDSVVPPPLSNYTINSQHSIIAAKVFG